MGDGGWAIVAEFAREQAWNPRLPRRQNENINCQRRKYAGFPSL